MPDEVTERNRRRVLDIYAAYASGDMAFLMDALTEDVCWESGDDAEALPWCGCHNGRAAVEQYFADLTARCRIVDYRITAVIADGGNVAVTAMVRVHFHASGAEREIAKVDVLRLRDGQVCAFREYYDTSRIARDLQA